MELLKTLTPAETYFIIHKAEMTHKQFLRFTLMDLILKGVLTIVEIEKDNVNYTYVQAGVNFNTYTHQPYEESFLRACKFDEGYQTSFKNYITIIMPLTKRYKRQIAQTPHMGGYFYRTWLQRNLIGGYSYTNVGAQTATILSDLLKKANEEYRIEGRDAETKKLLGNNIILLNDFNSNDLRVFDEEMKRKETASTITGGDTSSGWWYFDSGVNNGFDADYGSASDSSGDSGGDGDSGCSGCGGCGGGD
ncbi:MAG: hypothetical protein ACO1PI_16080 [Bacteroidota bacterium]